MTAATSVTGRVSDRTGRHWALSIAAFIPLAGGRRVASTREMEPDGP